MANYQQLAARVREWHAAMRGILARATKTLLEAAKARQLAEVLDWRVQQIIVLQQNLPT
jgi:hypothetical protein